MSEKNKYGIPFSLFLGPGRVGYFSLALFLFVVGFFIIPDRTHHRNLYYIFGLLPVLFVTFNLGLHRCIIGRGTLWSLGSLFLVFTAASAAWSSSSGWSDAFDMMRYLLLVFSFFLFVIYAFYGWSREQLDSFFWVLVVAVAAAAAITMAVHYVAHPFPGSRVPALTRHGEVQTLAANMFGFFSIIGLVFLLDAGFRARMSPLAMVVLSGSTLVLLAFLVLAQTRGALLGVVIAISVFLMCKRSWRILASAMVVALAFLVGLEHYASIRGFVERGVGLRPEIWLEAFRQISERPFLGHGRSADFVFETSRGEFGHPHNMLVYILLQTGAVGLGLWLMLTGYAARNMYVIGRTTGQWWLFSVFVFSLVAMLFTSRDFLISPGVTWLLYWLPVALLLALQGQGQVRASGESRLGN